MFFRKLFILVLLLGILKHGRAQVGDPSSAPDPSKLKQQIPTSPEASALGKFGDIPVGLYTGVPNITAPLYTLKIKDFELPISLTYNSSGIKVEELAPNTGLGWALNAGGTISCSVNGMKDFLPGGFASPVLGDDYLPPYILNPDNLAYDNNQNGGGSVYQFAKRAADGTIDTQPDLFYYSIPGASGKFYIDQQRQIHPIPFSAIKITYNFTAGSFSIIDEGGRIFTFATTDGSSLGNNCGPPIVNGTNYLTKIQLPSGDIINFTYDPVNYSYDVQPTMSRKTLVPGYNGYETFDCNNIANHTINMNGVRLSAITSTAGHNIKFVYKNNRADLPGTQSLDSLVIRNADKTLYQYAFNYGYFGDVGSGPNYCRLKLTSIVNQNGAKYTLSYNETIPVVSRLSFAQDHWGYFNGKTSNNTLLPIEPDYGFFDGANREIDSAYSQMAVLKQITYPTGGYSKFNYEQNDYYFVGDEKVYNNYNYNTFGQNNQNTTTAFTIPVGTTVLKAIASFNDGSGPVSGPGAGNPPVDPPTQITISGDNGFFQSFYNGLTPDGTKGLNLTPGNYTISVNCNAAANGAFCKVSLMTATTQHIEKNKLIGGLRIQSIVDQASVNGNQEVKQYVYRQANYPTRSSGNVNFYPLYTTTSYRYQYGRVQPGGILDEEAVCKLNYETPNYVNYWKQSANSVYPLGSIKGGSVGYTFVTMLNGINGANGKNESTFTFVHNSGGSLTSPLVPFIDNDWQNGLLIKEVQYRNQGGTYQPIVNNQNFYSIQPESVFWNSHYDSATYQSNDYLRGRGVIIEYKRDERLCGALLFPAQFRVNDFRYVSEWVRSDSSKTVNYNYNNGVLIDSVISSKQVVYNNPAHLLPNIITMGTSRRTTVQTKNSYPQDYPIGTSAAIDSLVARHQIAIPLEKQTNNNGTTMTTKLAYKNWTTKITEPEFIQTQFNTSTLENRIQYLAYDDNANVISLTLFNGPLTVYLWGYNRQYPIAEVKNATYQSLIDVLGQTTINQLAGSNPGTDAQVRGLLSPLRTDSRLKNAQVTTYTYDPLVGMTSSTDPKGETTYYEYDSFQRLMNIKDKDGNIVKHMDYHYQGQ